MSNTMNQILSLALSFWKWILLVAALMGVIPLIYYLVKYITKKRTNPAIRFPVMFIASLLVILMIACGVVNLLCTTVPPITGLTVAEAKLELFRCGLTISLPQGQIWENDDQFYVVNQKTAEGTIILRGSPVVVEVADTNYSSSQSKPIATNPPTASPEPSNTPLTTPVPTETSTTELNTDGLICVPNVCAMEEVAAVAMLAECGLDSQVFWTYPDELVSEQYYIIDQSIPAGSYVAPGTLIEIERGITQTETSFIPETTEMVLVPNVYSLEESAAITILAENRLTSSVYWSEGNDTPQDEYYVIAQSIPSGSIVPVGTEIKLERGIVQPGTSVIVPDVVGMEQTAATKLLVATGLQFQVSWSAETDDYAGQYYIESQSLPKGTTVPAGTLIELMLTTTAP